MGDRGDRAIERVRKLLAQARDRVGTPEGEVFEERAFELMARYGIDEGEMADGGPAAIVRREVTLVGAYVPQQRNLVAALAHALHCVPVAAGKQIAVYGAVRHVERVVVLFAALLPTMMAGARAQGVPAGVAAVTVRKSWMLGYAASVRRRLREAESGAAGEMGGDRAEVALLDDLSRAHAYVRENLTTRSSRMRPSALHAGAYRAGEAAAGNADLGQSRVGGCRAVGA